MIYDAVVIGAGLSGLTAASLLSKRGIKTAVIDNNFKPGGSCGIFKREEAIFDQGSAMLFGFGESGFNPHRFVFNCLEEPFTVIKHDLLYVVNFNGNKIRFWPDIDKFIKELSSVFHGEENNLKKFYKDLQKIYSDVMVENPVFAAPDETNPKAALKQLLKHPVSYFKFLSFLNKNTKQLLDKYFKDSEIFKFFDKLTSTYCYTTVLETPAVLSAVMFVNNHEGGSFYPAGSTLFLPGKLEKAIEENGGNMIYNRKVVKIIFEDNKASGVLLDNNEEILSKNIIYSGTVWNLYDGLIEKDKSTEPKRKWATGIVPTYSSMVLYALVKDSVIPADTAPVEMLIGNPDKIDESEVTVYIHSIDDRTLCKKGSHVVMAIGPSFKNWPTPEGEEYKGKGYENQKQEEYERLIRVLEKRFPGFLKAIEYAEVSTPTTIERYTMKNWGCVAGPKQSIGQHMFKRLHTKTEWDSLYCCGESTVMGTGTPAVTVSGISAANAVLKKMGLKQFEYEKDMKNYVRVIEAPAEENNVYFGYREEEIEIMKLSSKCRYCENPECCKEFDLDIRGILRRASVGNIFGAKNIIKNFEDSRGLKLENSEIKNCENNCIRNKPKKIEVEISDIILKINAQTRGQGLV